MSLSIAVGDTTKMHPPRGILQCSNYTGCVSTEISPVKARAALGCGTKGKD